MGAITIGKTESVEASDIVDRPSGWISDRDKWNYLYLANLRQLCTLKSPHLP